MCEAHIGRALCAGNYARARAVYVLNLYVFSGLCLCSDVAAGNAYVKNAIITLNSATRQSGGGSAGT